MTCKCFARCEADCVCDYDWTPPEVTRLRHDIERHIAIASELATENGALRAENERLLYDAGELATNLAEARATISRLREYAEHTTGCDSWAWPGGMKKPHAKCDCGYDELIRSLEEKP